MDYNLLNVRMEGQGKEEIVTDAAKKPFSPGGLCVL